MFFFNHMKLAFKGDTVLVGLMVHILHRGLSRHLFGLVIPFILNSLPGGARVALLHMRTSCSQHTELEPVVIHHNRFMRLYVTV